MKSFIKFLHQLSAINAKDLDTRRLTADTVLDYITLDSTAAHSAEALELDVSI